MDQRDFKKLLIDLDTTRAALAREVELSGNGVKKYFQGKLNNGARRAQIKRALQKRARERGLDLPDFW